MTAADLVDGLTGSECRQALLAFLQAVERHDWHRDTRRLLADIAASVELAERLAVEPADYQPIPVETRTVRHVHIVRALTDEQREAIRREYIPRPRGGRNHGPGPSLAQLAQRYGVSYTAARNAVREAA